MFFSFRIKREWQKNMLCTELEAQRVKQNKDTVGLMENAKNYTLTLPDLKWKNAVHTKNLA